MEALIKHWREHGEEVHRKYCALIADPSIINDPSIQEFFEAYIPLDGIDQYHIHHDISKPYVIVYDVDGKAHYPNHWESSSRMYACFFGKGLISDLILHDMDFHTKKGDDLRETWKLPYADHLYATAWASLLANADLFGGMETDSFKIKKKKLIKALKLRLDN